MAEEKGIESQSDESVRDRESQIAAGLIGVLLVIGAFLTYNYFQKSKEVTTEPLISETIEEEIKAEELSEEVASEEASEEKTEEEVKTAEEEGEVVVKETEGTEEEVVVKEEEEPTEIVIPEQTKEEKEGEVIAAEEKTTESTYVVKEGDCCLWEIAKKVYNNPYEWTKIDKANSLARNSLGRPIIHVGDTLNLPAEAEEIAEEAEAKEELPTTYMVERGDNLWKIAETFYGDGLAWTKIWDANNLHRLPDGTVLIHAGNILTIPE